jgi:hypothetical protein
LTAPPAHAGKAAAGYGLVPSDAMGVLAVDLDALRAAPVYKELRAMIVEAAGGEEAFNAVKTMTGLDPDKDLKAVVMAFAPGFGTKNENFVLAVQAKANTRQIMAAMKKEGAKFTESKSKGGAYWQIDGEGALGFRGDWIVLAPLPWWNEADAGKVGGKLRAKGLAGLVASLDGKATMAGAIILPADIRQQIDADPSMAGLHSVATSLTLTKGLAAKLTLVMADAQRATDLVAMLQTQIKAAAAEPQAKEMGLDAVATKAVIKANAKAVEIQFALGEATIKQLLGMVGSMMAPRRSPPVPGGEE